MGEADRYTALLVDFGGVMTTSVWDSFAKFCTQNGLQEDAVKRVFREDPDAIADLRQLETGAITEDEFERRFAKRLGMEDSSDLIDSMPGACSRASRWWPPRAPPARAASGPG